MSVIFDQLRISDDGSKMYLSVHVNKADYFKDVYIDSIAILTSEKVSETNPFFPTSNYIYKEDVEGNKKEINLVLTPEDFVRVWESEPEAMKFKRSDMGNTLFFVYVKTKNAPDSCTPCRLDEEMNLAVTFDENMLYQRVMDYTKELVKDCTTPTGFIDFILLWNAFKAAIETEHYIPAIKFFGMLFGTMNGKITDIKDCGCHG